MFAFGMRFWSKKLTKNPSKTRPESLKNRCRKRIVFQHRFFRVSASILEPLGVPTWTQFGSFGPKKIPRLPFFYPLKLDVLKNGVLEGSGLDFGASGARFGNLWRGFCSPQASGLEFARDGHNQHERCLSCEYPICATCGFTRPRDQRAVHENHKDKSRNCYCQPTRLPPKK